MVDFVEKRQLNPNASGEEGLLHKPKRWPFIRSLYQRPWMDPVTGIALYAANLFCPYPNIGEKIMNTAEKTATKIHVC